MTHVATPKTNPGDYVYIKGGAYLRSTIDNAEEYLGRGVWALVISSPVRYIELEEEITGLVNVFIADKGVFLVEENMLLTPEQKSTLANLPIKTLHEW